MPNVMVFGGRTFGEKKCVCVYVCIYEQIPVKEEYVDKLTLTIAECLTYLHPDGN